MAGDVASQSSDGRTGIEIEKGSALLGVGTAHHRIRSAGGSGQNLMFERFKQQMFLRLVILSLKLGVLLIEFVY